MTELKDGERGTVAGRIDPAGPLVESPSGEACVYWDQRKGLDDVAIERGGELFWVTTGSTRVLVRTNDVTVSAKADRREEIVEIATSEIATVSAELRELKAVLRERDDPEVRARRRHLAKVATLLCTLRAHARGNVHGKGNLTAQAAWIDKNQHLASEGPGQATIQRAVERWEMTLAPGDEVTLSGWFQVEPMPAGLGGGGGYRDRPTCIVAREATIVGRGDARPQPREERAAPPSNVMGGRRSGQRDRGFERRVLLIVSAVATAAAVVWLITQLARAAH